MVNRADIAVGAPYGGPDGLGAVFIYHGFALRSGDSRDPAKEKPAQVRTTATSGASHLHLINVLRKTY